MRTGILSDLDDWGKDFVESTVGNRGRDRDSGSYSVDLTEALDPEWYFREQDTRSPGPGQIRKVGFGKQKVAFIDDLGTETRLSARHL